jgi:hypothetical protein
MSTARIYFGAQASKTEEVSAAVQELGLNLLRTAPYQLRITAHPTTIQPNYAIYKDNISSFIRAASTGSPILPNQNKFASLDYDGPLITFPFPKLAISFERPVAEEVADQLRNQFGFENYTVRGKAALLHPTPSICLYKYVIANISIICANNAVAAPLDLISRGVGSSRLMSQ